jgi:hypothetical protein
MLVRNYQTGRRLGILSIFLAVIPLAFILLPGFPQNNLTGYMVICGGGGASLLCALGAGLVGSRLWFLASLGPAMVAALVLLNP